MMKALGLSAALIMGATAAMAQTSPRNADMSAAPAAARLQAQGYSEIHDLKRNPDGSWTAVATRNGMSLNVVEQPDGKITTR